MNMTKTHHQQQKENYKPTAANSQYQSWDVKALHMNYKLYYKKDLKKGSKETKGISQKQNAIHTSKEVYRAENFQWERGRKQE